MRSADLAITLGRELREDQVPFVGEEQHGVTAWRQMDAGAADQIRHTVGLPDLLAGASLQTDEFAGSFRREYVLALQEGRRSVA